MSFGLQRALMLLALLGLSGFAGGCENGSWLSLNIVIPLGLSGDTGLLSPWVNGTVVPVTNGGGDVDPPIPVQVGNEPIGGTANL